MGSRETLLTRGLHGGALPVLVRVRVRVLVLVLAGRDKRTAYAAPQASADHAASPR